MSNNTNQGGIVDTVASAVNTATENIQAGVNKVLGTSAEARQEANKEQAKHGNTLGDKIDGATGYISATGDRAEAKAKEEYHDKKADAQ